MNFERQLNNFTPMIKSISYKFSKATFVPIEELESSLREEFYLKSLTFDEETSSNFASRMKVVLSQRALRVVNRKEGAFYKNSDYLEDKLKTKDRDNDVNDLLGSSYNLEEEVISASNRKTTQDKRQLIEYLTQGEDMITTAIVKMYLDDPKIKPAEIGAKLGISRTTVSRRLRRMSDKYDESKFGDLDSYLAV